MARSARQRLLTHGAWVLPALAAIAAVLWFAWPEEHIEPRQDRRPRVQREDVGETHAPPPVGDRSDREKPPSERRGVRVQVLVVDAGAAPVAGADVEVRALARYYTAPDPHAAMVKDENAKSERGDDWGNGDDPEDDDEWGDDDEGGNGDDWGDDDEVEESGGEPEEQREVVETARTDRNGIAILSIATGVDVVIHAHDDTGRAGSSVLLSFDPPRGRKPAPETARVEEVRVEIADASTILGRITNERGVPVPGARVFVNALTDAELDDAVDAPGTFTSSNADGAYSITLHASGAFRVSVQADGFHTGTAEAVQALPGRQATQDFVLVRSEEITGVVLDAHGNPVARVWISAALHSSSGRSDDDDFGYDARARTDERGRFRLGQLQAGRYVVSAEPAYTRPAELFDVPSGSKDVTVRLTEGGRVTGTVTVRDLSLMRDAGRPRRDDARDAWEEADGTPVFGGDVLLVPVAAPVALASGVPAGREDESIAGVIPPEGEVVTDFGIGKKGTGRFEAAGLPPGTYDLVVSVGNLAAQRRVQIREGASLALALEIPDGTVPTLRGRLRTSENGPFTKGRVMADPVSKGSGSDGGSASVLEDGTFEFPWMRPGKFRISALATSEGVQWAAYGIVVDVPSTGGPPLEIEVHRPRAIMTPPLSREATQTPSVDKDWAPDVEVDVADGELVVVSAPGNGQPRLLGGDRIVSIDDQPLAAFGPYDGEELLYGAENSLCRITAHRPATGETFTVVLPRNIEEDDGW